MTSELFMLAVAVVAGGALGAFFFGGLHWTIARGLADSNPAAWFLGSLVVRTGVAVLGFAFVGHGRWDRILACLLGFFIARMVITRLVQIPAATNVILTEGADHAP